MSFDFIANVINNLQEKNIKDNSVKKYDNNIKNNNLKINDNKIENLNINENNQNNIKFEEVLKKVSEDNNKVVSEKFDNEISNLINNEIGNINLVLTKLDSLLSILNNDNINILGNELINFLKELQDILQILKNIIALNKDKSKNNFFGNDFIFDIVQNIEFIINEIFKSNTINTVQIEELKSNLELIKNNLKEYIINNNINEKSSFELDNLKKIKENIDTPIKVIDLRTGIKNEELENYQNKVNFKDIIENKDVLFIKNNLSKENNILLNHNKNKIQDISIDKSVSFDKLILSNLNQGNSKIIEPKNVNNYQNFLNIVSTRAYIENLMNSVAAKALIVLKDGKSEMKMNLNPPELGRMSLKFVIEDGNLTGKIIVNTNEAKQLFEQNLSELHRIFNQAGVNINQLDVGLGQSDNKNKDDEKNIHMVNKNIELITQNKEENVDYLGSPEILLNDVVINYLI